MYYKIPMQSRKKIYIVVSRKQINKWPRCIKVLIRIKKNGNLGLNRINIVKDAVLTGVSN